MRRRYKIPLIISGIVFVPVALFFAFVIWFATGGGAVDATPGTFRYRIGIADYMKDIPIIAPCNTPVYSYEAMDVSPGSGTIKYNSYASQAEIEAFYRRFLVAKGCAISGGGDGFWGGQCANNEFQQMTVVLSSKLAGQECSLVTLYTLDP